VSIEARKIRLIMQLRRSGVTDTAILSVIERVPRELFVPPAFQDQAYEDQALPIGEGQTISQPLVVARMTLALGQLHDRTKVLEIGTGSGYQAAVLSRLCRRVYTIERHRPLLREAEARFRQLGYHNITTKVGDGTRGWPEQAPFDRIIVTAAADGDPPKDLTDQLAIGGVMVIPLAIDRLDQRVYRIHRTDAGLQQEELWPVRFVPLVPETAVEPGERTRSV
jgi:protein-L-isoaspartate(D-aspartate) O-methyltransferase